MTKEEKKAIRKLAKVMIANLPKMVELQNLFKALCGV